MTRRTAVGWMAASLHNQMGRIVQNEDEAGIDSAKSLEKHSADVANQLEPVYA